MKLIEDGANVNGKGTGGYTGLHQASKSGHHLVTKCLIVNNANIDEKDDREGKTLLMYAASGGQLIIIQTLLLSGADNECTVVPCYYAPLFAYCLKGKLPPPPPPLKN